MQLIGVSRDVPQKIAVQGTALRVINHPQIDYNRTAFVASSGLPAASHLLIGFDRTPSATSYDAIVSPFTDVTISIPDGTRNVSIVFPNQGSAWAFGPGPSAATLPVLIDWLDFRAEGAARPLDIFPQPDPTQGAGTYKAWVDEWGGVWTPSRWTLVHDQQLAGGHTPNMRPHVAPSQSITRTGAVVANTLTAIAGLQPKPDNSTQSRSLLRAFVSVSGAGLFVLGDSFLTVGSPGNNEVIRYNFAAAGGQAFDFGEGFALDAFAHAGLWKFYASTAITVDLTVITG